MLPRTLVGFALLIAAAGSAAAGDLRARVIIQTIQETGTAGGVDAVVHACGGRVARRFRALSALLADVPADCLDALAEHPEVRAVSADRPVRGALQQTTRTSVGAAWVVDRMGFDGNGIGVAIVDSGAAAWHDDLGSRVVHFADF